VNTYYDLLALIHEHLRPDLYVEIGVHEGHSLSLVQPSTRIVGVDPEPKVTDPPAGCTIVTATSDEFFVDPVALADQPIDLSFADGLHHWEQTLRDVTNLERHASPDGTLLIHDCNPIDEVTSTRERTTVVWSGDVWKTVVALRRFRPDLNVHTVDVEPTGLAIVTGLDPSSRVLLNRYDQIVAEIDQLTYADLDTGDRAQLLGLIPDDWALTKAILSSSLPSF
jgi:hypothetical protein